MAASIAEPISKPATDLAEAFPTLSFIEMIIVGLLNLSLILEAIIPIIPSCQSSPLKVKIGSLIFFLIVFRTTFNNSFSIFFLSELYLSSSLANLKLSLGLLFKRRLAP